MKNFKVDKKYDDEIYFDIVKPEAMMVRKIKRNKQAPKSKRK